MCYSLGMNRKSKPGFNPKLDDVAGMAATAFEALSGAQGKVKNLIRDGAGRIATQMDLVTREEAEDLFEMISAARTAQEKLDQRLSTIEAHLKLGKKPEVKKPEVKKAVIKPAAKKSVAKKRK